MTEHEFLALAEETHGDMVAMVAGNASPADAEVIVRDVVSRLHERRAFGAQTGQSPRAWLKRCVWRGWLDTLRRRTPVLVADIADLESGLDYWATANPGDAGPETVGDKLRVESDAPTIGLRVDIERALASLAPEEQECARAVYLEGRRQDDVPGYTRKEVRTQLSRALPALRQALKDYAPVVVGWLMVAAATFTAAFAGWV